MLSSVAQEANDDNNSYRHACKSIAEQIESSKNLLLKVQILKIVRKTASEYHLRTIPRNEHIIQFLQDNRYRQMLMVKPAKTASGVAVIAVMPKPYGCPHGRCIYCPGGIEFNTPLSYTGSRWLRKWISCKPGGTTSARQRSLL